MERFSFPSSDQVTELAAYRFVPENPRAMVQISHGMCEYFGRYIPFAEYLAALGFLVFGHDHLGHGNTAKRAEDRGFTAEGGGANYLVEDVHNLSMHMKEQYPALPLVLFGHSMGSFIAREVTARYGEDYTAAIYCGTGGPEAPAGLGRMLASLLMIIYGEHHRSPFLKRVSFMGYNKKFGKGCDVNAWLTRDTATVARYKDDELCSFVFTLRAYHDLFTLVQTVSKKDWATRLPKTLPLLVVSGEDDPVGGNGRGVRTVGERLKAAEIADLSVVLYPEMRHEILNEIDKETVWKEIAQWIEKRLPSQI
ncbi:MAG: lysophospholipase [Clostridia bacterium]|nr:lysophospholipase [Clostridia bacterium]